MGCLKSVREVQYLFLYSNSLYQCLVQYIQRIMPFIPLICICIFTQLQWPTIWLLIIVLKFLTLITGIELIIWKYYLLLLFKHGPLLIPDPSRANVRKIILHTSYNNIFKTPFIFFDKITWFRKFQSLLSFSHIFSLFL